MAYERQTEIARVLRQRIERAVQIGALTAGDRLPSTREIAAELSADPRVVAAAYRRLVGDGIVTLRERSGVYVGDAMRSHAVRDRSSGTTHGEREWLADLLTEGVGRGVSAARLPALLHAAVGTDAVRTAVIATLEDQTLGMCRELTDDFGLACRPVSADALASALSAAGQLAKTRPAHLPPDARRANLWITTHMHGAWVTRAAESFGKRVVVAGVREDLLSDEWLLLMLGPVYVIGHDPRFLQIVRKFIRSSPRSSAHEANVRLLVAGRDDLSCIPPDAPTYVTEAARRTLGRTRIPGRLIPPARVFARDCVRAILQNVVELNLTR